MIDTINISRKQTFSEELFNAISHGLGVLFAIAATVLMLLRASDAWQVVSVCVYGASMVFLYMASTLYHSISSPGAKRVLRVFDHCSIFVLIAGTYTPYTLIALRHTVGWPLFGLIWGTAILGIVLNAISLEKFKKLSYVLYLLMGWAIIMTVGPLNAAVPMQGVLYLIVGGIAYTAGMVFFGLGKKMRGMHPLWHVFVLVGSVFHFLSIFGYVLPGALR